MTEALLLALCAASPLLAAPVTERSRTVRGARRIATLAMSLALVAGVAAAATASPGWSAVLPAFAAAVGLIAASLTSVIGGTQTVFARILIVNGASVALVLSDHPVALAVAWVAPLGPVALALRASSPRVERSFLAYLAPSGGLVVLGAALLVVGQPVAGAFAIAGGVAIREAMVPAHSWMPRFVERAPMGLVVAFVAPQLGVYTHLRWLSAGLPPQLEYGLAALGAVTVVFAAALGVVQRRARRALGYLLMSQSALVAFGLEAHSAVGRTGALLSWIGCGLATAGLAMTLAALEARRGELWLDRPSGSFRRIPALASAFLVLGLASVGLPGTLGFVAEDLLVQGSVQRFPLLGLTLIAGTAINSVTVVRTFFALFTGTARRDGERDLTARERAVISLVIGALVVAGLWPSAPIGWLTDPPAAVEAVPAEIP